MSGLFGLLPRLHLPVEESAPSDRTLLLVATLPAVLLTAGLGVLGLPFVIRGGLLVVASLAIRYTPWFRRPEGVMLNLLAGWMGGEIFNLVTGR